MTMRLPVFTSSLFALTFFLLPALVNSAPLTYDGEDALYWYHSYAQDEAPSPDTPAPLDGRVVKRDDSEIPKTAIAGNKASPSVFPLSVLQYR